MKLLIYPVLIIFIVACAAVPDAPNKALAINTQAGVTDCRWLFDVSGRLIAQDKVADSQTVTIDDYPYLRSNRLMASFKDQLDEPEAFTSWLNRLQQLGMEGLHIELANLPASSRARLPQQAVYNHCANVLREQDFDDDYPAAKDQLISAMEVPDEYQTWKRFVGLYWLTAWATKYGTESFYEDIRETYEQPQSIKNTMSYIAPEAQGEVIDTALIMQRAYREHPLGLPVLDAEDRAMLFTAFAPNITVSTKTDDDRIGALTWSGDSSVPVVTTDSPTVYRHLSYTRVKQQVLVQLNYIFWFPARPKTSAMDYLGGNIDGLTWRVTLSKQGEPLVYDAIHNCGCYHLFFPTDKSCLKPPDSILEEPAFSFQALSSASKKPLTLQLAHTSHYLDRVLEEAEIGDAAVSYQWADYNSLRSVAKPGEEKRRQSVFQPDGIIAGTERGERFFLWPMGIPAPGEMRQWGHHATAFYGRRHFDDANIIERYIGGKGDQVCN